jgi:hypothetical protein
MKLRRQAPGLEEGLRARQGASSQLVEAELEGYAAYRLAQSRRRDAAIQQLIGGGAQRAGRLAAQHPTDCYFGRRRRGALELLAIHCNLLQLDSHILRISCSIVARDLHSFVQHLRKLARHRALYADRNSERVDALRRPLAGGADLQHSLGGPQQPAAGSRWDRDLAAGCSSSAVAPARAGGWTGSASAARTLSLRQPGRCRCIGWRCPQGTATRASRRSWSWCRPGGSPALAHRAGTGFSHSEGLLGLRVVLSHTPALQAMMGSPMMGASCRQQGQRLSQWDARCLACMCTSKLRAEVVRLDSSG